MSKTLISFLIMIRICVFLGAADHHDIDFVYNGFHGGSVINLTINGVAEITRNGLLRLTNTSDRNQVGYAFFQAPFPRTIPVPAEPGLSLGTMPMTKVVEKEATVGNGMAFVVSPSKELIKGAQPSQYLGLFNMSNNGDPSNNITAVEFDTISSPEFEDINGDHVGIDINGLRSVVSEPTAYFGNQLMSLKGGYPLQVWVDYSGERRTLDVTVSTLQRGERPGGPFLSTTVDLSTVTADSLYVGFSACTGTYLTSHYVLGWSFKTNGQARPLDASKLPILPSPEKESKTRDLLQLVIAAAVAVAFLIRLGIVKQIASGLFYLHERWTHTVLHRDMKASNVLLDGDFNGRLGDFGLSRLYEHGSDPQTTRLMGTFGYMAPELNRTGRATKSTDVYAFGVFMLEVVCGRKPIDPRAPTERIILVDWVAERLRGGRILDVVDRRLGRNFEPKEKEEMELVLRVGLLCLNATAEERPSMEKVTHFLDRVLSPLPEVPLDSLDININTAGSTNGYENHLLSSAPPLESVSILVGGR
ncbi:hypothetical protein H6P81_007497 [Aristolochia fimbriata]|uniref:non-specific serine/threonine protein kinase n=1 Tax=Aristolochia fimbriata TaxID=158543 RepID=A0AAV7F4X8_ARIFI|nr:hypothetical protein H6P81_007497 [Aristolochia fimbriata]